KEEILALMAAESWYDADAAVAAGLADETFDGAEVDLPEDGLNMVREFKRPPQDLLDRVAARAAGTGTAGANAANAAGGVDPRSRVEQLSVRDRLAAVRALEEEHKRWNSIFQK